MAATYTIGAAFDTAKYFVKEMPLDRVKLRILDNASKYIWMAAPWRWSIGVLDPIPLSSNVQDYTVSIPSDFLYITECYIADGTSTPRSNLKIVPKLPSDVKIVGQPGRISYEGNNVIRTFPKPGTLPSSPIQYLLCYYKKSPPTITASDYSTAGILVMDDAWSWVYDTAVLWQAYLFSDDQRAGTVEVNGNSIRFSGIRAALESAIMQMKQREKIPLDELHFPQDPPAGDK